MAEFSDFQPQAAELPPEFAAFGKPAKPMQTAGVPGLPGTPSGPSVKKPGFFEAIREEIKRPDFGKGNIFSSLAEAMAREGRKLPAALGGVDLEGINAKMKKGEKLTPAEEWGFKARLADMQSEAKAAGEPSPGFVDTMKAVFEAAKDNPSGFAGQMAAGMLEDPEMLALGGLGTGGKFAGLVKKYKTAAKLAGEATEAGVGGAAASALQQEAEQGRVRPGATVAAGAQMAVPLVALHEGKALLKKAMARPERDFASPKEFGDHHNKLADQQVAAATNPRPATPKVAAAVATGALAAGVMWNQGQEPKAEILAGGLIAAMVSKEKTPLIHEFIEKGNVDLAHTNPGGIEDELVKLGYKYSMEPGKNKWVLKAPDGDVVSEASAESWPAINKLASDGVFHYWDTLFKKAQLEPPPKGWLEQKSAEPVQKDLEERLPQTLIGLQGELKSSGYGQPYEITEGENKGKWAVIGKYIKGKHPVFYGDTATDAARKAVLHAWKTEAEPTVKDDYGEDFSESEAPRGPSEYKSGNMLPEDHLAHFKKATATPEFKNWFGQSQVTLSDGRPRVMFHGTASEFHQFQPGTANAIFVSPDPKFAQSFSGGTEFANEYAKAGAHILPVFVAAEYPFDYQNAAQVQQLADKMGWRYDSPNVQAIRRGDWSIIETRPVQAAIRELGHDGFWMWEAETKNLAVYKPTQLKSAIGNTGSFHRFSKDITGSVTPEQLAKLAAIGIGGAAGVMMAQDDNKVTGLLEGALAGTAVAIGAPKLLQTLKDLAKPDTRIRINYIADDMEEFVKRGAIDIWKVQQQVEALPKAQRPSAVFNWIQRIRASGLPKSILSATEASFARRSVGVRDPATLLALYGNSVVHAIGMNKMTAALKAAKTPAGAPLVAPVSKAPAGYVSVPHPSLAGFVAHPDIESSLRLLYDSYHPSALRLAARALLQGTKRALVSFSLFHANALAFAAQAASSNPVKFIKLYAQAVAPKIFGENQYLKELRTQGHAGPLIDKAIQGGVKFALEGDLVEDVDHGFYEGLHVIQAELDKILPGLSMPLRGLERINHSFDRFVWERLHAGMKLDLFAEKYQQILENTARAVQKGTAKPISEREAAQIAGSFVNSIFGGLNWRRAAEAVRTKFGRDLALGLASPSGRRVAQLIAFAPDWLVSTTIPWVSALGKGTGVKGLLNARTTADLHRQYLLRSAFYYLLVGNAINQAMSGHNIWENKDPFMIDLDPRGERHLQWNKHFMEVAHWFQKPVQQALGKLSYPIKETANQLLGTEYLYPHTDKRTGQISAGPKMEGSRLSHALGGLSPIAVQQGLAGGSGQGVAGFLGAPIYGKTREQRRKEIRERRRKQIKARIDSIHENK